jgi:DNA invertase Pin-like site-specific DNA recombinase
MAPRFAQRQEGPNEPPPVRAAQYVRMSTEHQQYSTENQAEDIARYAELHGLEIVRTYADEGKSGLNLEGRVSLQQLITDVTEHRADFDVVLVYDISRWGRFQDADQSAYYEYICRNAGVKVQYCAEQFDNDGSIGSTIIKTVKRAMAGEYSRELSTKVFAGQCRLIGYGFRQGGAAGFGLRRVLVDETRQRKTELSRGEQKSIQTDRVVLELGPEAEVETVRRMYRMFTLQGLPERVIAAQLNSEGSRTDLGREWTRGTVHQVLTNEKYIGNNVFNRTSFKLKQRRVRNPPEAWVRAEGVFEPVVELDFFAAAQRIIQDRCKRYSDDVLLERLSSLFARRGQLSGLIIDETEDMPSSSAYRSRFGSLVRAYELIGYSPARDYRFIEINRALRAMHAGVVAETVAGIEAVGGSVEIDRETDLLHVNREFTAYHLSPESKFRGGEAFDQGRTERRHVQARGFEFIGKEADRYEEAFVVDVASELAIRYGSAPPSNVDLQADLAAAAAKFGDAAVGRATGLPRSTVAKLKTGRADFIRSQPAGIRAGLRALQAMEREALSRQAQALEDYRSAIQKHGGLRAAANALGLDPSNLSKRLRRQPGV